MGRIPVIAIDKLESPATLAAIDRACRDWGFFQVVGHGIEPALLDAHLAEARRFFALPDAVKRGVERTAENAWGYFDRELTKNTRDWKQIFDVGPADGASLRPQWPSAQPGLRPAVLAHYAACETLAFRLLGALSRNLGMPGDHLAAGFRPRHSSFLRLNYYPACPAPERPAGIETTRHGHLGINHHTDAGALTVLQQDHRPGLEVYRHGEWHVVEPLPGALVINIGDIVQVWSNDRYRAALHRVTVSESGDRLSAAFFFNPDYAADYAPLPSTVEAASPARYRAINWGEFRARRAAGDYADLGVEVQIEHYRTQDSP
ncbi:MAG: 2OG-Fe(II) oxygenase family protein [Pseudomonadales bacterium]